VNIAIIEKSRQVRRNRGAREGFGATLNQRVVGSSPTGSTVCVASLRSVSLSSEKMGSGFLVCDSMRSVSAAFAR
jgi:hypothetical protein